MSFSTILILLLLLTVGVLVFYIFYVPPKMVTIVERPVYDYDRVSWIPWSWGGGGYGWPGAYYVNRPMPHFGGGDHRRYPGSGASGGRGVPGGPGGRDHGGH